MLVRVSIAIISLLLSPTSAQFQIAGWRGVHCSPPPRDNPDNQSPQPLPEDHSLVGSQVVPGVAEEGHQSPVRMMSSLLLLVLASTVTCYCPPSCSCNDTRWQRFLEILSHEYFPSKLQDSDSEWWKEISQSVLKYQLNVTTSTEIIFKLWWMVKSSNSINRPQIVFKGRGIDFNGMGWTIPASIPDPRPYS